MPLPAAVQTLILRSRAARGVSKDEASWFETRSLSLALLTMRL
jgi:hypothetical protein